MPFLRLGSIEIIWALVFATALALFLRVTKKDSGFAFGELLGLTPWAYAPKIAVTLLFSAGWSLGLVPESAFSIDQLSLWSVAYHLLSLAAIGVSIAAMLRAHDAAGVLPAVPKLTPAIVAVTLLAISGVLAKVAAHPERFRPVGLGDRIQALRFLPLEGPAQELTFPTDKPVVVDFWASWCPPCVDALPDWQRVASRQDATYISANVEPDNTEHVKQFLRENKYTFQVVLAPGNLQARLGVDTLPTLIAFSPDGEVIAYQVGRTNPDALPIERHSNSR